MSRESSDEDVGDRVFRKRGSLGTISDGWKCPTVGSRSIRRRRRMIHRNAVSSLIYINATYECVKNGRRLGEKQLLCQTIGARDDRRHGRAEVGEWKRTLEGRCMAWTQEGGKEGGRLLGFGDWNPARENDERQPIIGTHKHTHHTHTKSPRLITSTRYIAFFTPTSQRFTVLLTHPPL